MPVLLQFRANPLGLTRPMPREAGDIAHANVFGWLRAGDACVASAVHSHNGRKPFSIGPLQHERRTQVVLRMGVLRDELLPVIHCGVMARPQIRVIRDFLNLDRVDTLLHIAYDQMPATPLTAACLRFDTPVHFHSRRFANDCVEPWLLMQSWALAWEANALPHLTLGHTMLEEFLHWAKAAVRMPHADVVIRDVCVEGESRKGIVGEVVLDIVNNPEPFAIHAARLLHYATFAGTGYKTSHGLGSTELVAVNKDVALPWCPPVWTYGRTPLWLDPGNQY